MKGDDMEENRDGGGKKFLSRADFEAEIVKRAWDDPFYKKRLLTDPRGVIEEELRKIRPDAKLPENIQVYVHEETPNSLHIALPMNPAEYGQISDDEWLDNVSGGFIAVVVAVAVSVAAVANVTAAANAAVHANAAYSVNTVSG